MRNTRWRVVVFVLAFGASALPAGARLAAETGAAAPRDSFAPVTFEDLGSWQVGGDAAFDATVSASTGSGSVRLPSLGSAVRSPPLAIRKGNLYFVGTKVRQDSWPRGNVAVAISEVERSGAWISNLPSHTVIAPFVNGEFSSSGLYFTARDDIRYIQVVLIRSGPQASTDPMWVDDVFVERAPSIRARPSPKLAFDGTQTRVSALGNWEVRRSNGTWEPWFPICAAVNPARLSTARYRSIAAQGFNCDIWNGHQVVALEMAKAAGLRSFAQIAQYTNDEGWAVDRLDVLVDDIRAVNRSPAADYLAGFFLDNENSTSYVARTRRVVETIRATDVEGTKRRRPILQLQGNYGSLGLWSDEAGRPFSDAVGAYVPAVNSGGAGSAPGGQFFLASQPNQKEPTAYCQVNDGIGVMFRAAIYGCLAQGSRAISYWGDGPVPGYPEIPDLERQVWWPDMPAIASELRLLGPLLRGSEQTSWSATIEGENDLLPVSWGTRTLDGIGHLIVSNVALEPQNRTVTVSGLDYRPTEVRDFFTNARVATVAADGSFKLVVPAAGVGSGSLVLRVVPEGWEPPRTTTSTLPTRGAGPPLLSTLGTKTPSTGLRSTEPTKTKQGAASPVASPRTTIRSAARKATSPVTPTRPVTSQVPVAPTVVVGKVSPQPLCRGGVRLQAELAQIPIGTVGLVLDGTARSWARSGAPSALNWTSDVVGKVEYRFRYVRSSPGVAKRTMFAVGSDGVTVSKRFELPSTYGAWGTASVELVVPSASPVVLSASFDVTIDTQDLDLVDSVDVCPIGR